MAEYIPNRFLEKAVQNQDIDTIKIALSQIISSDPTFQSHEIDSAIGYAEYHGIKIYEDILCEDLEIITDRSKWNRDYFAEAMVNLQYNFRPERLEHVKEVGKYLYAKPEQPKTQTATKEEESGRPKVIGTTGITGIVIGVVILIILVVLVIRIIK